MTKGEKVINAKLDILIRGLVEPDDGWYARVNKNTTFRKVSQKIGWLALGAMIITAVDTYLR